MVGNEVGTWRVLLAVAMIAVFLVLVRVGSGTGFFFDEWDFLAYRRGFSLDVLLQPHNGHLVAIPNVLYSLLSSWFGIESHTPFRTLALTFHLGVAFLAAVATRRVRGDVAGIAAFVVIGLMGAGWQNIFWAFQIGFVGSIAFFLAGWLLLDPASGSFNKRRGAMVSVSTLGSLLMSGVGVAALGAIVLLCLADPRRRQLWWIPVGPAAVYGLWQVTHGTSSADLGSVDRLPQFALQNAGSAAGGVFGLDVAWGQMILGVVLFLVVRRFLRERGPVWSFGPALMYCVFVSLATVSRSTFFEPGASRYVYLGIIVLLLTVGLGAVPRPTPVRGGVAVMLAGLAIWGSHDLLSAGATNLEREWRIVSSELAVVEEHRESLSRDLVIDPVHAPQLTVGAYLDLVEHLGPVSVASFDDIERSDVETRSGADALLGTLVDMEVTTFAGEDCAPSGPPTNEVELRPGDSVLVSPWGPGVMSVRRFAPETTRSASREFGATVIRLESPADSIELAYRLAFDVQVEVVTCR